MRKFLLALAVAATCSMMASAQETMAQAVDDPEWDEASWLNILTAGEAVTVDVDAEGQSITVKDWLNCGCDLIVCYNDDEDVTSVIPVVNGVEGAEIFPSEDYGDFAFYLCDDCKYYYVSLYADYCYAGIDEEGGYVFLSGYFYESQTDYVAGYYSIEWTAPEDNGLVLIYDTTTTPEVDDEWGTADDFFMPDTEVAVGVFEGNQIVLDGWTGSASDVMLIEFDENENLVSMVEYTEGEPGSKLTSDYGGFAITNPDYTYCQPYLGEGYCYAYANEDGGYVIFGAYFYPTDGSEAVWLYYYVSWDMTGITSVEVSKDLPVEFYNINGMRIDNPTAPGLYIQRQGSKAVKTIIR